MVDNNKIGSKDWYFRLQKQVSELTNIHLQKCLNRTDVLTRKLISPLIERKILRSANMRPLLFYIGFCFTQGKFFRPSELKDAKSEQIGAITAALELINISSYYINHFLDDKDEIKNPQDAKNRVLAGIICRELAHDLLCNFSVASRIKIMDSLSSIQIDIHRGQAIDINELIFDKLESFSPEQYHDLYFRRCRLLSGHFYGRCIELGMEYGGHFKNEIDRQLVELYTKMSTLGQFANDIGDFAPPEKHSGTQEKNYYKDYCSDFLNGRLTYPNYLLLSRATKKEKDELWRIQNQGFYSNFHKFVELLKNTNAISESLSILHREFRKTKKAYCISNKELNTLIGCSLIIFKSNKLLTTVRDLVT